MKYKISDTKKEFKPFRLWIDFESAIEVAEFIRALNRHQKYSDGDIPKTLNSIVDLIERHLLKN